MRLFDVLAAFLGDTSANRPSAARTPHPAFSLPYPSMLAISPVRIGRDPGAGGVAIFVVRSS